MTLDSRTRPRSVLAAGLIVGLVVGSGATASATETEEPRAASREGGVTTCDPFGGGPLVAVGESERITNLPDLVYEGGQPGVDTHLSITDVPEGITVTAIVVKGGARHNVYVPGERALSAEAPWKDLHAPPNDDGGIPVINHWFACGEESPTLEPTPESDVAVPAERPDAQDIGEKEPMANETEEQTLPPMTEATGSASPREAPAQEKMPNENAAADDLASTGFSGGWLVGLGVALLAGGGALLALTRRRRGKAS